MTDTWNTKQRVAWYVKLRDAGSVSRFHNVRIATPQDDAQHSHAAALIAHSIATEYNEDVNSPLNSIKLPTVNPERCSLYMLIHDIGEIHTGDMPGPFKSKNPEIGKQLKKVERQWLAANLPPELKSLGTKIEPSKTEIHIIDFVDEYECYLKVLDELKMGNRHVGIDVHAIYLSLLSKSAPTALDGNRVLSSVLAQTVDETTRLFEDEFELA